MEGGPDINGMSGPLCVLPVISAAMASLPVRLVLIEWLDSLGCSSEWSDLEPSRAAPLVCRSVGWLLHDTDICKVIVPHVTNTDDPTITPQGCGDMTIPSCAVTRMIDLREAG